MDEAIELAELKLAPGTYAVVACHLADTFNDAQPMIDAPLMVVG
jgi:hypothetical protein